MFHQVLVHSLKENLLQVCAALNKSNYFQGKYNTHYLKKFAVTNQSAEGSGAASASNSINGMRNESC